MIFLSGRGAGFKMNWEPLLENDLRCALSATQPRIDNLVQNVTLEQKLHWSLSRSLLGVAGAKIKYNLMYYPKASV